MPLVKDGLVIVISQSGETIDTLAAMREAKRLGARLLSIVNVVGSTIARESDDVLYTWAGPEIAVATAKAYWEELKPTLSEEQRRTHPARWCLAEVCNVHSPAIEIEPIHRVVFGVDAKELYAALDAWDQQQGSSTTMSDQRLRLADAHGESAVALANPPAPLTVGSVEAFLADFLPAHPGVTVDYIHGESTALALASDPAKPATAILLPDFAKADLFKGVVLGGVLPRKTFSMGHAEEKRYYIECRKITE